MYQDHLFMIFQLSTKLTGRASTSILAYLCHLIPSIQHKDGQPVAPLLCLAELCMLAGGYYYTQCLQQRGCDRAQCSNNSRQLRGSSRCSRHFPPRRQELWRAYNVSPPKSSLALYSSQQPAQDADTALQSSQTFARELSFVPGTVIRLESLEVSYGGQKSSVLSLLLDHFQLLSRFFRSQGILRHKPDLFAWEDEPLRAAGSTATLHTAAK